MKLYETITAENWRKTSLGKKGGTRCLLGHVQGLRGLKWWQTEEVDAICDSVRALYPDRVTDASGDIGDVIATFNDHPDTTVEDVIRVCKVADV